MIEMDDTLTYQLTGKEAVIKKIDTILNTRTTDVPYYNKGVDLELFTYGNKEATIRRALSQFDPSIRIEGSGNSRVVVAGVNIDISKYLSED